MRRQRRSLIIRSLLVILLGGIVIAVPHVPPEPWASVGADIAMTKEGGGKVARERPELLDDQEERIIAAIGQVRESAVALEYATAEGPSEARRVATGVVINEAGDLLSIRIDPPPATAPIVVRDASGRRHPAQWLASDAETGLTLLRIKPGAAPPIRAARHEPRLGGQVLVIGNPFGLGHSVLRGHISGLDRRLELGPWQLGGLIQIAVSLHPGDSGALVANLRGEWLGLIRSGLALPGQRWARERSRQRSQEREHEHDYNLGFAIPARDALWVADQLRTRGRVDRAYLGVRIDPGADADPPGAVLLGVLDDSPAGQADLRAGDRVIALNGHAIKSSGDLTERLDHTLAGTEVAIDLLRDGRTEHRIIRAVSRPASAAQSATPPEPEPEPTPSSPPDDLRLTLPREVLKRLEVLERRLEALEKRAGPNP